MKLVSLLPLASVVSLGLVSATDITVTSGVEAVKSTAVLANTGAAIKFCPTGACDTLSYTVKVGAITEYAGATAVAANTIANVNADTTAAWSTTPADVKTGDTIVGKAYKFTGKLQKTADAAKSGDLELTATYYAVATDVTYATETIKVPAGGVKFTAVIKNWAFDGSATPDSSDSNTVKVDFVITSTSKTGTGDAATATVPKLATSVGTDSISLATTIGDGMFLGVPNKAITATSATPPETANVDVTASLTNAAPFTLTMALPNFKGKTLTYDPVMYYTAPAPAGGDASPSPSPSPSGASSVWGYAASAFVGAAAIAAMMF